MAYIIKCLDRFYNPQEISGADVRGRLVAGEKRMRKFIVFASRGLDTLVVIGPPLDPTSEKYPRFYFHKHIREAVEERYHRTDIAGGGHAFFVREEADGVAQDTMVMNGESSDFGVYPDELATDPEANAALVAWYGATVTVA